MNLFGFSQFCTVIMLMLIMPSFTSGMKIEVYYDREYYPVVVDEKDTVATLKTKIEKIEEIGNIRIQKQVLFNKITGSVLEDNKTMDEYGIKERGIIYMEVVSDIYYFPIDVNYGSKQTIVWVKCTDTVKDLKNKIAKFDKLGKIPIEKQTLTKEIAGKFWIELSADPKTIDKYAIGEGQNVFVSLEEFKFLVEYKEKMYPIKVNAMSTLKEVKEKMAEITGIPTEKQRLSYYLYGQCNNDKERLIHFVKNCIPFLIMSDGSGIIVEWQNHCEFVIYVNGTDTVATLKAKIEKIEEIGKIPIQKQVLFNEITESVLADEKTMGEYGIGEGDTIYMEVVTDTYFFRIDVNYGSIKNIVWGKRTDTVKDLKKKIANFDKLGKIPIQKQVLFNENTKSVLEDNKTMDEYGIGERGTIYMEVVTWDQSSLQSSSAVVADGSNFHIHVSYGSNRVTVLAKGTDTVKDLKKKIANFDKLGNIPVQKQVLTKEITWKFGIELADDEEIDKYAIGEGKNVFVSWDEFEFFVEYKEKMYPINGNAMTTLKEVKEKMAEITGIPTEKQTLSHYKNGQCNDKARLIHFVKEDTTFLIMSDGSSITVEWQNHFWEFFVINVNGTDTVATVKQKISEINKQRHKSELNGAIIKLNKCDFDCKYAKALEDKKTMDEYGIGEGKTIHMKVLYWEEIWDESSSPSSSAAVADGSEFHIHVLYGSARRTVWVKGMDTVQTLKHKVRRFMEWDWQCKFGDISLFKLPFRAGINELVDNEKTMDEYDIKEGDIIESLDAKRLC